ncbi:protein-export membrane protein SecF [Arthrobacter sp. StoSoilA2]|uniref:protein translocase subunit SecF n=1 Tax=unclassified Arthrobacter TaxID=235627 RepID=UPI001CC70D9F|nr:MULTISPECIES: protein translocase subunit SecF [unclassified Arthrobacter]MDR6687559.1 preprotein translocase subunit SecF [Arthrobacter sp. 1088]BCW36509.1 protein-export membrane protein SecF [Arthrobacter sp. StoSoilA2]BCW48643.1 protein-export membrane protein SecF [Arthrobacter sp. StoSoilB13]
MTTSFATFGNELYTGKRSYNFVDSKKIWFIIAAVAVALSILIPVLKGGFNLGIEFRGGSEFTVSNVKTTDAGLGEKAVHDVVSGAVPRVANVAGNTMRIQTDQLTDDETNRIKEGLTTAYGVTDNEVTSNFVGPTWGQDVTRQALIGLVVFVGLAAVLMALYFRTWKMSLSALVGMLVTMFTTAGVYALSDFEVTPSAIIGFLTVLSYSLYDTVVVFDKIRENTADISTSTRRTFGEEVNLAVNQTLVRSINTMMVAVLPVAAILFIGAGLLGAGTLRDLSLALFVGILIGTAATIFIAAPLYAWLRQGEPDLVKQAKKVAHRRAEATV